MTNMHRIVCSLACPFVLGAAAAAQTTIVRWNFEDNTSQVNQTTATVNASAGLLGYIGGTTWESGAGITNGTFATSVTTWPAQGNAPGTAGLQFTIDTTNFANIKMRWDNRHSNTSSRYMQVQYSTDGLNFFPAPVTQEPEGTPTGIAGTFVGPAGDTWFSGRFADFSSIVGANNNPTFTVRVVSVYEPSTSAYKASNPTGTYATTGKLRFDNVEFTGTSALPQPPTATASASPATLCIGGTVALTVNATPGQNPALPIQSVTANLTAFGNASETAVAMTQTGPGVYTLNYIVPATAPSGPQTVTFTVTDTNNRSGTTTTSVAATDCTPTVSNAAVVISQVYSGGGNNSVGNGTSVFDSDFIELFNRSDAPVSLAGKSLQYAAPASDFALTHVIPLPDVTVLPGKYFLVRVGDPAVAVAGGPLPTPDLALPVTADPEHPEMPVVFGMSNTDGKVALVDSIAALGSLSTCFDPAIIDFVGYGSATCFEGGLAVPGTNNTVGVIRCGGGCQDGNQNVADFQVLTPTPRNSGSPAAPCGGVVMRTLTVVKTGPASGTVTSNPAGLDCGSTCSFAFASGTQVTLTAAGTGSSYKIGKWDGAAATSSSYVITLDADTTVTAYFTCVADLVALGGGTPVDGSLTVDDLVAFLAGFFANSSVADLVGPGGTFPRDGVNTVDDLVYYLAQFFSGCP
ncbi:MAG: GC-type dockerin domain-anchored protein [Phycisphaerales bacterium]